MRVVTIILATLLLLITAGLGALGTSRGFDDASKIDEVAGPMKETLRAAADAGDADAKEMLSLGEKTGSLRAGAIAMAIAALVALGLLVMTFVGKGVPVLAGGLLVLVLLAAILTPSYDTGPLGPMPLRTLAIVVAVIAALGAASSYGAFAIKRRRAS
jgi:hypothetical protein